jgi:hypothetical protein
MCKFTTIENKSEVKGIFFQNPLQKLEINFYGPYTKGERKLTFIDRFINRKRIKQAEKEDWDSIVVKVLTLPIYFTRYQRKSIYKFNKHITLDKIISYGWEPYDNSCGGAAEKEITKFYFKDGTTLKVVNKEEFKYTYRHIIEEEFCK